MDDLFVPGLFSPVRVSRPATTSMDDDSTSETEDELRTLRREAQEQRE